MEQVILLKVPPLEWEVIWGDGSLARKYNRELAPGLDRNNNRTSGGGGFSGSDIIADGPFAGQTMDWLYKNHKEYFGTPDELRWDDIIPVGGGILHAAEDLSVQVHPREDWAQEHLGIHGKSECWYIVDCPEGADIVMGHKAKTFAELDDYIAREAWEDLVERHPIWPGCFYAIKAGTLHAIQKGTTFIEVCNPCPVTYRFYDYDRLDADGKPRYTDIPKTRENILVPNRIFTFPPIVSRYGGVKETWLANNEDYSVWRYEVDGKGTVPRKKPFMGCFVIEGQGTIDGMPLEPGRNFFVSRDADEVTLEGKLDILCCHS